MKPLPQLFRQPVKTLAGVLLIAFAVTILIVSAGQFASTQLTKENLSDSYSTVALISDKYYWEDTGHGMRYHTYITDENARAWKEAVIQNRKDLFLMESFSELYSAYIPRISPDNFSKHENGDSMGTTIFGHPYRSAVLEIKLTGTSSFQRNTRKISTSDGVEFEYLESVCTLCTGTVESVVELEKGFTSPVGKTIAFILTADTEETLKAMQLEIGERYLIYGMDYSDMDGDFKDSMVTNYLPLFEEIFGAIKSSEDVILEQFDCYMSVCDYASLPIMYNAENGFELRTDLREFLYKEGNLVRVDYIPSEEFVPNYTLPTVAKLDSTADAFIHSNDSVLWRQMLDNMEISNHGFPVLAVDKLGYQMAFIRGDARIVEGRDFTEAEREEGAKVCILSESLAIENGISIGDTLAVQAYANDYNVGLQRSNLLASSTFPSAGAYSHVMGFTSEPEEYTIVGLYRQNNAWENKNDPYGFTPNLIFVPKGSISGDARTDDRGILYTLVLHNGKMEALQKLQNEAGYPDLFLCFDQGYTEIAEALDAYEGVSQKAFYVGLAGCAVILILFFVLFPLQQGQNLAIMCSLGAPRGKRIGFILGSSLGILLPGALLGGTAGALLWKKAAEKLMESVHVTIPMSADTVLLSVSLTGILLLGMLILVTFLALIVSGEKGLIKRK